MESAIQYLIDMIKDFAVLHGGNQCTAAVKCYFFNIQVAESSLIDPIASLFLIVTGKVDDDILMVVLVLC